MHGPAVAFRETKLFTFDSHIGDGHHYENMDKSYFYFVIICVVPCSGEMAKYASFPKRVD